jgi:hypothetical protein
MTVPIRKLEAIIEPILGAFVGWIFACPRCGGYYRRYPGDGWACRRCAGVDYASRHRNRTIPKWLAMLRRQIGGWDRDQARPAVGEGFPVLLFRLQAGSQSHHVVRVFERGRFHGQASGSRAREPSSGIMGNMP